MAKATTVFTGKTKKKKERMRKMASTTENNHSKIKYLASTPEARKLLKQLTKENELTYHQIQSLLRIKRNETDTIIQKLVEFKMMEQSHKWAHGHTQIDAINRSTYTISDFGVNFIANYEALNNTTVHTNVAQLSKGDFAKFKHMLQTFTTSEDNYEVREAYEFIFGVGSKNSNFYYVSKNKLLTAYRKMHEIKRAVFTIINNKTYDETTKQYHNQIKDFAEIAVEINQTLQNDQNDISHYLKYFKEQIEKNTDFYARKSKQVFGINQVDKKQSQQSMKEMVVQFADDMLQDNIYKTYNAIITHSITLAHTLGNQLEELEHQMERKAKCITLARDIMGMSIEDAQKAFMQTMMNKPLFYVSQNEHARFEENVLWVQKPKEREVTTTNEKPKIDTQTVALLKEEAKLESLKMELAKLEKINALLQQPIHNQILDHESYRLVKQAIASAGVQNKQSSPYELQADVSPSKAQFIIKTKQNDKTKRTVYERKEIKLYADRDITEKIQQIQSSITQLTARIADKKSNQPVIVQSLQETKTAL